MQIFKGIVQKGSQRGSALGFPTINIALADPEISGIYAARVVVGGRIYQAAAFADQKRSVLEAHILDANLNLYGKEITIELLKKIRESKMFSNDNDLRAAIADDIQKIHEYFLKEI